MKRDERSTSYRFNPLILLILLIPCVEDTVLVDFHLYLITDRHATKRPLVEAARLALEGGVRAVQLREKDLPIRELLAMARDLRQLTREFNAKLFINERVDVAIVSEADGVHVGVNGIPVPAVRHIVGDRMLIGASTHNIEEAKAATDGGANFITFGPLFETPSKMKYGNPVGIKLLNCIANLIAIPVFGLGGVKSGSIAQIMAAGAHGIACISAILSADDIKQAAERMVRETADAGKGKT